jgi:ABC-type transport system involved in multi-copper enzyme maturation permease subunit
MKNIFLIMMFTIREALSKKIMITFIIVSSVSLLGFGLVMIYLSIPESVQIDGVQITDTSKIIQATIKPMEVVLMGTVFILGLFLSFFSCAGFIPNLLKKGNIDLFLSKPIAKFQLLLGKYLGAVLMILVNISYLIFGFWLILGLKFSVWDTAFLSSILTITYVFAVIYALMLLTSVLTKSPVLPLILSFLIVIILSPILSTRENIYEIVDNSIIRGILETLYYIVPQSTDITKYSQDLIIGVPETEITVFFTSGILLLAYLSSGIYLFHKKDF